MFAQAPQFLEILWLNVILSGDNAVVIGLAAAGLPRAMRARAVPFGIVMAAVLRIIFSIFATFLLGLWWVDIVGGLALIAWIGVELLWEGAAAANEELHLGLPLPARAYCPGARRNCAAWITARPRGMIGA